MLQGLLAVFYSTITELEILEEFRRETFASWCRNGPLSDACTNAWWKKTQAFVLKATWSYVLYKEHLWIQSLRKWRWNCFQGLTEDICTRSWWQISASLKIFKIWKNKMRGLIQISVSHFVLNSRRFLMYVQNRFSFWFQRIHFGSPHSFKIRLLKVVLVLDLNTQ